MTYKEWRQKHKEKKKKNKKVFASRKEHVLYEIKSWAIVILAVFFIRAGIIEAYQIPTGSMEKTINVGDFLLGNKFSYGARTPDWIGIPFTRIGFDIPYYRFPPLTLPKVGDIVIFKFPLDPRTNYVKRCLGAPGDTVEILNKKVYVNGVRFEDPQTAIINYSNIFPATYQEPQIFPSGNGNRDQYNPIYVPKENDVLILSGLSPKEVEFIHHIMILDGHSKEDNFGIYYEQGVPKYKVKQNYYFMMGDNRDNSFDSRYWGLVPYKYVMGKPLILYFSWDKTVPWSQFYKKVRWNRLFHTVS
ncbi:MAG: signal peptidase I [Candidatus Marinimicrobia bacterium]|nr:signal peptidase I [Candidatus Neomarinimicrobiota bacterium]MDD5581912.1 signal peptidase I [Candidatus Neomarinimicrobiota bacterium]